MKHTTSRFLVAIFAVLFFATFTNAQSGTYAIKGAKIVTVSGATIENGTVVIRDGLIESVGSNVQIPADAKILDGTGLMVYPGLIDAVSNIGLKKPAPPNRTAAKAEGYPAELRAERKAADILEGGEANFKSQRNNGITTVLTVAPNGIFQGYSTILNLAGDTSSEMIITKVFGQHASYRTIRGGVFPSSLLGTFAAFRQMFSDAKRLDEIQKIYQSNPRGMKRPESDPTLEALIPIVNGAMPIIFTANTEREIIRTLNLAKEFNLKAIIAGGLESAKIAGRLKQQNVPVLLSLDFPKRKDSAHTDAEPESLRTLRLRADAPKNAAKLKAPV